MSLPACQQRALDRMEGALRASEPHLASMYAIVLVPVMFAAIIVGALLGGSRGTTTCEAGYSVGGVSPLNRLSCPVSGKTVKVAVRKTISATARLACTAGQAARFTSLAANEQAVPPVARAHAAAAGPPPTCQN